MVRLLQILPAVIIFLISLSSWGEQLYAPNGIGVLIPDNTGRSRGMGGAGIASNDGMNVTFGNPALNSSFKNPWYALGLVYNRTTTHIEGSESLP
ncbi:MAG: hypothetical protein WCU00_12130, partial [Candidatus Latescibacterota bacterium]